MVFAASGWRTSWHRGEPENAVPCLGMTTIYQEIAVCRGRCDLRFHGIQAVRIRIRVQDYRAAVAGYP